MFSGRLGSGMHSRVIEAGQVRASLYCLGVTAGAGASVRPLRNPVTHLHGPNRLAVRGDRVTFFRNGQLEYITGDGRFFAGTWFIDALRDLDDDLEFTMDADFFEPNGRLAFRWLGTIDRLTNNNFNINISEVDGTLRLKWDKL